MLEGNQNKELSKPLKDFIKLRGMKVVIHNFNDSLLFLKDDIQQALDVMKQKELAHQLGVSEPAFSLMVKFFKSLDNFNYSSDIKEFTVSYDISTYTLVKE